MKNLIVILFLLSVFSLGQVEKDSVSKRLEEVVLTAKKPLVRRKIDRLEFNISHTPLQNLNAWEILKNTANIQVKSDRLSVQGSSQVLVSINDKRILMNQDQLKQFLENTEGENISAIEVITNPPSKYEAAGSAVINIKLKRDTSIGYKGRISGRYHQSIYAKGKVGVMQNYNSQKWNLSGTYDFISGNYVRKNTDVSIFETNQTRWETDMVRKTQSHEQHLFNFSAQYSLDSLQTIQFGADGIHQPEMIGNYRIPTIIYQDKTDQPLWNYLTANDIVQRNTGLNSYFQFDKKKNQSTLTFTSNFSTKSYQENQDVQTFLQNEDQSKSYSHFATDNLQQIQIISSRLDYRWDDEKFTVEGGGKFSNVRSYNSLKFFEAKPVILLPSEDKSNTFNYRENIFALYLSGSYKVRKLEIKAGLRAENTAIRSTSDHPQVENKAHYLHLFPTLYLSYQFSDKQQIGFTYGKRISRPDYDFLNPSKSYYNLYSYFQGDAHLKSTLIDNVSINYTVNDWNFETYYRYSKNPSMEISVQNPMTFETVYRYTNIDHSVNIGGNFSKNFRVTPNWTLNFFGMAEYNEDYFYGSDAVLRMNKVLFFNADVSTQITLDNAKTWDLNLAYGYNSKSIQGSFTISPSQRTNIILNKKLLNNALQIGLVINDIFKTDRNTISTRYADQHQYFKDYRDTQYFLLNVRYNFGNQKVKDVKNIDKTEEQNRL